MKNAQQYIVTLLLVLTSALLHAQDLNCRVQVIHPKIQTSDDDVFSTLQKSISDFLNNTKWTDDVIAPRERIEANILITISEWDGNTRFKGTAQIQSSRPVYGTSYNTPVFIVNDKDWEFNYSEQEPLEYVETGNNTNLALLLTYYANIIIGFDYDTFSMMGGNPYFTQAQAIVNQAQSIGFSGWRSFESNQNRFWLVDNLLSIDLKPLREMQYIYHRKGLDIFFENISKGRTSIFEALPLLQNAENQKPGAMLVQLFFTAKSDELANILKEAGPGQRSKAINLLTEVDPSNANKYRASNVEEDL